MELRKSVMAINKLVSVVKECFTKDSKWKTIYTAQRIKIFIGENKRKH